MVIFAQPLLCLWKMQVHRTQLDALSMEAYTIRISGRKYARHVYSADLERKL
jgi:hypothetical protein